MIRYGGQIANIPKIAAQDTVTALTVSKVNGGKMKFFCSIRTGVELHVSGLVGKKVAEK